MPANKSGLTPVTPESLATLIARSAASADKKFTALSDDISSVKDDISGVKGEYPIRLGEGSMGFSCSEPTVKAKAVSGALLKARASH
jgi:hypothetical protein